jgi:hypothetical protein
MKFARDIRVVDVALARKGLDEKIFASHPTLGR